MKTIKHAIVWACVGSVVTTGMFTMLIPPAAATAGGAGASGGAGPRGCFCRGDLTNDNVINTADLVEFLGLFGTSCPPDTDCDGIIDSADNCPQVPNPLQADADTDNVGDDCDNCPFIPNPGQQDSDNNGVGDACQICAPGSVQSCYTGPAATDGVGVCQAGNQTCIANGTAWGPCQGEVVPSPELCNGLDDNCNGQIDENPTDGTTYYRDNDNDNFGRCNDFIVACQPQGTYRATVCGDCNDSNASIRPGAFDPFGDGIDQDCDGVDG